MPDPSLSMLARYQPWRRRAEIGFWIVVLLGQALFNTVVSWLDLQRATPDVPLWQPATWELSSTLVIGALIPALAAFERRFPLRWDSWRASLPWHLLGSLAYCAAHVGAMVLLRKAVYALAGSAYVVRDWPTAFGYEYLKDVRTYLMILVAIWSYRLVLLRLQGEARLLDAPEPAAGAQPLEPPAADDAGLPAPPTSTERPERFLVRKLRKEFLIAAADIAWVQAQGNYVGLHVNGHDYLLRSTLAEFLRQLDPARFVQVHRSYAVNLDRIAEIEPQPSGDARLKMKDGSVVPCSRRYRDALA
ncbi:LytTR family DNA-binding domain-containing protein [Ramlibacter sp.]|uniref:LytTR family DNA-binding domain-containing protein n=1 Tax=Ramlibacter sp. TaxID=1917967 RepID=UPI0017B0AC16|nr:LytTR family DNA-binding domain-containing protein [Ramlibacter sp.]MBA2673781.1 LytTR family transcriptional regulator [Ramlibacter sp.]